MRIPGRLAIAERLAYYDPRIVFLGGGGHCTAKWSQVVMVALWALESSGSGPKRVPGPSRTAVVAWL